MKRRNPSNPPGGRGDGGATTLRGCFAAQDVDNPQTPSSELLCIPDYSTGKRGQTEVIEQDKDLEKTRGESGQKMTWTQQTFADLCPKFLHELYCCKEAKVPPHRCGRLIESCRKWSLTYFWKNWIYKMVNCIYSTAHRIFLYLIYTWYKDPLWSEKHQLKGGGAGFHVHSGTPWCLCRQLLLAYISTRLNWPQSARKLLMRPSQKTSRPQNMAWSSCTASSFTVKRFQVTFLDAECCSAHFYIVHKGLMFSGWVGGRDLQASFAASLTHFTQIRWI